MFKQYQLRNYNFRLLFYIIVVTIMGILIVGSAQESSQDKQIFGMAIGMVALIVCSLIDYHFLLKFQWLMYLLCVALLVAVLIFGKEVNGATRWILIFGIQFQPSELAKVLLILFFSKLFSDYREYINTVRLIGASLILIGIPLFLVYKEPNLSTTIAITLIFCSLLYVAGLSYKIIGGVLAVVIPLVIIFFSLIVQPDQPFFHDYQQERVLAWLEPEKYPDIAYQQLNSKMAIGSGQLYGKGLDTNEISSVKNGNFIAEPQTDFIFAVAGEELGFIGCCAIIILLFLIVLECIWMGRKARDLEGTLICCGMGAFIGFQSFINIGVATGLLPNTGIPLPFVSYGLTSLVTLFIGMGIVLNVGMQPKKY